MKTINQLCTAFGLLALPGAAIAHSGHEPFFSLHHEGGTIMLIVASVIVATPLIVRYVRKKIQRSKKQSTHS